MCPCVHVCGHMHVCADKQALLPVHPRANGQLNTELKSHYPCWEMWGEAGVGQESRGWDGWGETREWEKEGRSSLDQNSVCWSVWAVSGKDGRTIQRDEMTGAIDVGTALVWGVNLSWRPSLMRNLRPSASSPSLLIPCVYYKIITRRSCPVC